MFDKPTKIKKIYYFHLLKKHKIHKMKILVKMTSYQKKNKNQFWITTKKSDIFVAVMQQEKNTCGIKMSFSGKIGKNKMQISKKHFTNAFVFAII